MNMELFSLREMKTFFEKLINSSKKSCFVVEETLLFATKRKDWK